MPVSRSLLALSLVFYSFHASAFFTASADKPDPYARRHYTAADLPAAKRKVAAAKKAAASKGQTDAEIMAEIEREDRGTEAANPTVAAPKFTSHKIVTPRTTAASGFAAPQTQEPSVRLKVESPTAMRDQAMLRKAGLSSDDLEGRRIVAAARGESYEPTSETHAIRAPKNTGLPPVTVCRFSSLGGKQNRNSISSRYLISDSDGFDACNQHGGEVTAGNDDDRSLMNVKDSAILKRAKK